MDAVTAEWIAVDWGTTNLRAFAMAGSCAVASAEAAKGMAGLAREDFEPALLEVVGGWLAPARRTDIVACGMVGSRQGWVEADYEAVPWKPGRALRMAPVPSMDPRIRVHVLHGLKQMDPPDVMRGEETQIAGFLAGEPNYQGVICLPGTHTKWAEITRGEVRRFTTIMTGELFALIGKQSVLRYSIAEKGWSEPAFEAGVRDGLSRPETISAALFAIRAGSLLTGLDPVEARAKLSGLLIGIELAGTASYRGGEIVLIGSEATCRPYAEALRIAGAAARVLDATEMTLAGLSAAHGSLQKEGTFS